MFKRIKKTHIFNGILLVFALLMIFSPGTKALVSQGLMKIGLFKPNLSAPKEEVNGSTLADSAGNTMELSGNGLSPVVFMDSSGKQTDAANLKGKVVFINFWATWCPPCIAEMPSIEKLYQRFRDHEQVVFLMVDVDNQMVKSEAFMAKRKFSLPVHVPVGQIPGHWLGSSIPTTVILDKNGMIAARHEGMADYSRQEVVDFINELIAE